MNRRHLLQSVVAAGLASVAAAPRARAATSAPLTPAEPPFALDFAPHIGMFEHSVGKDELAQIRFMHEAGFRAFEDVSMMSRTQAQQRRIGDELARLGMRMGIFTAHELTAYDGSLPSGDPTRLAIFLEQVREAVDVAERTHATHVIVVPGQEIPELERSLQVANVTDALHRALDILEPHGLTIVVEPLSQVDGYFLIRNVAQAQSLCRAVNRAGCRILYDIYHQQMAKGDLIDNFERAWSDIGYIHIGDVPGRNEPTSGEINYDNLFKYFKRKGYRGILGMEHGASASGAEGERKLIAAYRALDPR